MDLLKIVALCVFVCIAPTTATGQNKQTYPERPITIIVPYQAGDNTDLRARVIGEYLEKRLEWQVVIQNTSGAGGQIGAKACAKAKADGYTICALNFGQISYLPAQAKVDNKQFPYEASSFTPLAGVSETKFVLVVNQDVGTTFPTVLAYARTHYLNIGFVGAVSAVAARALASMEKSVVPVPYKGSGEAMASVLGKHIQAAFVPLSTALSNKDNPALRIVGVVGPRSRLFPNIPSLSEQGGNVFGTFVAWDAFFAPVGVPKERAKVLTGAILRGMADENVLGAFKRMGLEPRLLSSEALKKQIEEDIALFKKNPPPQSYR